MDDLLATVSLGRHVTQDGTIISWLSGGSIEMMTQYHFSAYLPKLATGRLEGLSKRLNSLQAAMQLRESIASEALHVDWVIHAFKARGRQVLSELDAEIPQLLGNIPGGNEGILNLLRQIRKASAKLPDFIKLSDVEFDNLYPGFEQRVKQNPLADLLMPSVRQLRTADARFRCRAALLRAAIHVQILGKDSLIKLPPDPFGDGPFQMVKFPGGFKLLSELKYQNGAPLSMTVGIPLKNQ